MWLRIANVFQIGFIDDYLTCYRVHSSNSSTVFSHKMKSDRKIIMNKWNDSSYYSAAVCINRLIDGESIQKSIINLFQDTWVALINLKQPYRVLRLFFSNIKRKYITIDNQV